jgi:DNA-binding transcriptional LysR family regulator
MDSEALRTFVSIHRAGGISAAAAQLGRSQPAISRRLALLEARVGAPLFERVTGGLVLTSVGEVLLPFAERVTAQLRDAAEAVAAARRGDAGAVSMAVVGTLAGPALSGVVSRFASAFPTAELALQTAASQGVSDLVRQGAAAIGVRYHPDTGPDVDNHPLAAERRVVVCRPSHPLGDRRIAALTELASETWLVFPADQRRREPASQTIFAEFLVRGVPEVTSRAIDSLTAQKRLVEAGQGLALLQESAVGEELKAGALATIAVSDLAAAIPVVAITRRDGYLSDAAQGMLRMLALAAW